MLDFRNRSKNRFAKEMEKLLKDLYVSALDRAEKILRPDKKSDAWKQFRFGILNLGNDKIRQLSDRLEDYTIEFRPAIFSVEYKVDVPQSKVVQFDFCVFEDDGPVFTMRSTSNDILSQIKDAMNCGFISYDGVTKTYSLSTMGLFNAFHKVIPLFDKNESFKGKTLERYNDWKEKVYDMEKANVS